MNWNMIEGRWTELKGEARKMWGDITDDELAQIAGEREKLEGVVQKKYGMAQEDAMKQVDEWAAALKEKM
jgi:uncharacterized protein YjbJ (UPF0337 family)